MDKTTAQAILRLMTWIDALKTRVEELEKEVARVKLQALPKDMSLGDQLKAVDEHTSTPMTYAEMRERFG